MTGAGHYQQAEALVAAVMDAKPATDIAANMLAAAQVHATLAQAAAVIEPTVQDLARGEGTDERIVTEWSEAVSG